MSSLLLYMLKTAVYLAGFYLIYFLFLSRDTAYARNRMFIILSVVSAFLLPLCSIRVHENGGIAYLGRTLSEIIISATGSNAGPEANRADSSGVMLIIIRIYIIGLVLSGLKLITEIISLVILIRKEKEKQGNLIRFSGLRSSAFSAFGHIFINDMISEEEAAEIIKHEMNHLKYNHFIDIILIESVKIVQWFNPAIYMLDHSIRSVHEFQADEDYLKTGVPVARYQTLLLNHIFKTGYFIPSNNFSNPALIKKRMIMMTKKRSRRLADLKLLLVLPLAAIIMVVISACSSTRHISDKSIRNDNQSDISKQDIFVVVEEMPVYPGGDSALMSFIYKNLIYPKEAKDKNIQGRVICRFAIMSDGRVGNVSVLHGVDPLLDNEATRVLKLMDKWIPGKQGGKPVNVWYSVPITYALR